MEKVSLEKLGSADSESKTRPEGPTMSAVSPWTSSEYIDLDGLQIHYRSAGTGPPIVFVHGYPTSSYVWRNIMPRLAESRFAVALDLPGFGLSDKPRNAPYTFEWQAAVFRRFIERLGLEKADLVVHDLGGPVALLWAVRNPERVGRIVILNTILTPEYTRKDELTHAFLRIPGAVRLASLTEYWMARETLKKMVYDKRTMTRDLVKAYFGPYASARDRRELLRAFIAPMSAPGRPELTEIAERLPGLEGSVSIIVGEDDPFTSEYMRQLQELLPNSKVNSIPNCGHLIQEDEPEELSRLLLAGL